MEVSIAAGEIVGLLYDAFAKQYVDPTSERSMKSLNVLCVRLVFCLYADDAAIFGKRGLFHSYLADNEAKRMRKAVIELFEVLDTLPENRDPYLDESLAKFPYVNGGLFDEKDIEIPQFTDEIRTLLLTKASENFNWSEISPTIFGAVFESTLNPETRRSGGMHYTSLENIHKVIDPLFFNALQKEFEEISAISVEKTKMTKLGAFQTKLASLSFLDPACGSGNFLTETYISLRRLENELLSVKQRGQIQMGDAAHNPIQVSIGQFYGIEVNDFAVTVARTALWIAESQMMKETEIIVHMQLDYLPLKSYVNIIEGNALQMDWESVVPKQKLDYIMGNPPFVGARWMNFTQKNDMADVFGKLKGLGNLDYVSAWYKKATDFMDGTLITAAYVSTNSITQGEQVAILWKSLVERGIFINFGVPTFKWNSEASDKAAVHCVIVGFSYKKTEPNISPYLVKAPTVFIERRTRPLSDAPEMIFGSMPNDGGHLIIEPDEYESLTKAQSPALKFVKRFMMGYEFINDVPRYCLWLDGATPAELLKIPFIQNRVEKCRQQRESSTRDATRKLADRPMLFGEIRQPKTDYIAIPAVSSENRRYIPIGFLSSGVIAGNKLFTVPDATLYHFGVLNSNVHMAWTRVVCGRLKSDYNYF